MHEFWFGRRRQPWRSVCTSRTSAPNGPRTQLLNAARVPAQRRLGSQSARESRCTSVSARGVGHPYLTRPGSPIVGQTSTPMDSKLSRVVVTGAVLGERHPNATTPSYRSLWVSASTASRTTTSALSVVPRPAAYADGVPAIMPGHARVLIRQQASEAVAVGGASPQLE